jgi:hypothetical protein
VNALKLLRIALAAQIALAMLGGLDAAASDKRPSSSGYWVLVNSNRDGAFRTYSVRPDGSHLTQLFAVGCRKKIAWTLLSRDRRTVVDIRCDGLYVARADGTHVQRLVKGIVREAAPSPDGGLVALTFAKRVGIWLVGRNGRGLGQLTSGAGDAAFAWSPDGRALSFMHVINEGAGRLSLVVQPLRGRQRVVFRTGPTDTGASDYLPAWSPDGRWIAYEFTNFGRHDGLYLVRRNGAHRHRIVAGTLSTFAWSPDGKRLALTGNGVVGVDGRRRGHVAVGCNPAWSPDGRLIASDNCNNSASVVGADGQGPQQVISASSNHLVGWTSLAPRGRAAPQLLPSERVIDAQTVATRRPVTGLSADETRVAFTPGTTGVDCGHVVVWTPTTKSLHRFAPPMPCAGLPEGSPKGVGDVELAGSRVAWVSLDGCGSTCSSSLMTALVGQEPVRLTSDDGPGAYRRDFYLHGDGDLLVYGEFSDLLARIGSGTEPCPSFEEEDEPPKICTTIRRHAHSCCAESVSDGLIAVHEERGVAIVDQTGKLIRLFQSPVDAARLDKGSLVVARGTTLQVFDVASGAKKLQRPLPKDFALADVDTGVAVLRDHDAIKLLRLSDGHSFTLSPRSPSLLADLEPPGLYYAYTRGKEGRVAFMPREKVSRLLDGS